MDAATYAAQLHNWTQFLRKVDPSAHFIGIGSQASRDPAWDLEVVQRAGHLIDYMTLHIYGHAFNTVDDYYSIVSLPLYVEERIRTMANVIDAGRQQIGREKPIHISIDEWNIRHLYEDADGRSPQLRRLSPRTLRDALTAAGVFHAMIRQCDVVTMANYVFLLNGNGVLLVDSEGVIKTPLFHLFDMYRNQMLPHVLDITVESAERITSVRMDDPGSTEIRDMAYVDAVASRNEDGTRMSIAVINRHLEEEASVRLVTTDGAPGGSVTIQTLSHEDTLATNNRQHPDNVVPHRQTMEWTGTFTAPPHSISLLTFGDG
jgi:alpha-N-arabinofuranosidase